MKHSSSIVLLTLIAMASPMALNAFVPAMPDTARALNTDIPTIQLTFTLYLFTLAIGQLISGPLADYYGRRPIMLAGLAIHTVGSLLAATAAGVETLILGRVLQALGGSAAMVLTRTIILDIYGKQQSAGKMGYLVMAIAIAQSIAPTLGGYLNLWYGWHVIFYFSVFIGIIFWFFALLGMEETCQQKTSELSLTRALIQFKTVLQSRAYIGYALSTTFIASGFYMFIGSAPYIVDLELGGSSADFGVWFLAVSLAFMAGSFLSTLLAKFFNVDQMIILGNSLSIAGMALLLFFAVKGQLSLFTLFVPMAVVTFGRGLSQPNAQTGAISSTEGATASASGLMGFIQLLTGALIAQSMPFVLEHGTVAVMSCMLVAPILAMSAHLFTLKRATPVANGQSPAQ